MLSLLPPRILLCAVRLCWCVVGRRPGFVLTFLNVRFAGVYKLAAWAAAVPLGHGRETIFAWFRSRFSELIPSLRLVLGTPSLLRLSRADGAVPFPGTVINLDDLTGPSPDDPRLLRSCAGGRARVQGHALSTLGSVSACTTSTSS